MEEKLKFFEKAIETLSVGITITDRSQKIIYSNFHDYQIHGYDKDQLLGMKSSTLAPSELHVSMTEEEIDELSYWNRESVNIRKDGSVFPVQLISHALKDDKRGTIGIITACMDITERKEAEKKLKNAYECLNEKSERLERFQKITVGRELEMIKLKKEVNELLERLGERRKYEAP